MVLWYGLKPITGFVGSGATWQGLGQPLPGSLIRITNNLLLVAACVRFGGAWMKLCSEWRLAATCQLGAKHVVQGTLRPAAMGFEIFSWILWKSTACAESSYL